MGSLSVVISEIMSTTTLTSTARSRVMVQVRVRGVPAVKEERGVLRDTPGGGTVQIHDMSYIVSRQLLTHV